MTAYKDPESYVNNCQHYFDYAVSNECEYGEESPEPCENPAPFYIWWGDEGKDKGMWVCDEHFVMIAKQENEEIKREETPVSANSIFGNSKLTIWFRSNK